MRFTTTIAFVLSALFFIGCAEKNPFGTVYIEGTVTVDGTPMQGISVSMYPQSSDGMSAGGITDAEGKFKVTSGGAPIDSGAKPGTYDVTFYKVKMEGSELSIEEFRMKYGNRMPPTTYIVPKKYNDPKTSGIAPVTVDTDKEKNKFTFELQSK